MVYSDELLQKALSAMSPGNVPVRASAANARLLGKPQTRIENLREDNDAELFACRLSGTRAARSSERGLLKITTRIPLERG